MGLSICLLCLQVYNEERELYAVKVVNLLNSDGHTDKKLMYEIHLLQVSYGHTDKKLMYEIHLLQVSYTVTRTRSSCTRYTSSRSTIRLRSHGQEAHVRDIFTSSRTALIG